MIDEVRRSRSTLPSPVRAGVAVLAIVMMVAVAGVDAARQGHDVLAHTDFAAFYCGARVAIEHHDPYAFTPLRACEAALGTTSPSMLSIDPDPLPAYDIALFAPLVRLDYVPAAVLWLTLLIVAITLTALLLARLTAIPALTVAAILAFTDGLASVPFGQTGPLITLGIVLAGYGLVEQRRALIFVGAALAAIEPHVGIPACCALFVWRPELRAGLVVLAGILVALSVAMLGLPVNAEYLRAALPVHAAAEAATATQYSLTWLLHYAGLSDANSLRIATVQYALFAVLGIWLARRVERTLHSAAALVFFPPVVALIGGSFVHIQQIAAALPFATLVAAQTQRAPSWCAVVLLAALWPVQTRLEAIGAAAIVAAIVLEATHRERARVALTTAALSVALYTLIAWPIMTAAIPAAPYRSLAMLPAQPRTLDGDRFASEADGIELRRDPTNPFARSTPRTLAAKLPVWIGLVLVVFLSLGASRARRPWVPARM